jgi:hypothetical protein
MLSYAVVDRDQERLAEELDIAGMIEPAATSGRITRRHWLRRTVTVGKTLHTRLASA